MKGSFLSIASFLATLFAFAVAQIELNPFPAVVYHGESYTLSWNATANNYTYTIWLVTEATADNEYQWEQVYSLGTGIHFTNSYSPSYLWTVPYNLSANSLYAIWMDALPTPFDGESFSSITDWFMVSAINNNSTPTSASPSATGSPLHTGASSVVSHHSSLSGGAIAGIVIGILAAVALIVAGAIAFVVARRRAAKKNREAAARANRLAPVMEESHEMHRTTQTATK